MAKRTTEVEKVPQKWLQTERAAQYLDCSLRTLQRLKDSAAFPYYQKGSKLIWYKISDLDKFIEQNRVI